MKIMFNKRYGLQQAVMDVTKTMTRRIVKCPKRFKNYEEEWSDDIELEFRRRPGANFYFDCVVVDGDGREMGQLPLPYKVGDKVAIAHSYEDVFNEMDLTKRPSDMSLADLLESAGWKNKMFVLEDLMPHHIEITDLWFERLQNISDEDCLKEGVIKWMDGYIVTGIIEGRGENRHNKCFDTPREAFAALIDRISGHGTWDSNPWVVVYTFKRID